MNRFFHFLLAASAGALTSCLSMNAAEPSAPPIENITPHIFTANLRADYLLFLPKGYDANARKRWPLILFLHGSGERGTNLWRTTVHGPTKYIEKHPDFPFILVTPQASEGTKWSDDTLLAILDNVTANNAVDTNRIYLTGLSTGGYGAWSLATTYPERFAAVAPICGGEGNIGIVLSLMDKTKGPALRHLPVWAFHGGKDNVVDPAESQRMVNLFKKFGNDVKLTIYPEAMHNSWTVTYDNPELYEWFLQHQRGMSVPEHKP
ncbi:MAG TPA: PHB depolymerase family esterase [Verrucomicrobiae bacterium]|jgi:predicted peptidase|nr:PHB depolymerase family esterase [Verrucomicrobiae bacterium]